MSRFEAVRTIRTMTSERFVLQAGGRDLANLDLHYLGSGAVEATLFLLVGGGLADAQIPELLDFVDKSLLPEQRRDEHTLSFTVLRGEIVGTFAAERAP